MHAFDMGHDRRDEPERFHDRFAYEIAHTADERNPGDGGATADPVKDRNRIEIESRSEALRLSGWPFQSGSRGKRARRRLSLCIQHLWRARLEVPIVDDSSNSVVGTRIAECMGRILPGGHDVSRARRVRITTALRT